jgi:Spy/CpxP family protein refolding chaperone
MARHHHHGGRRCGEQRRAGFGFGRGRFVLNRVLDRLDTTPGQEKVIREAVDALLDELHDARREFRGTRAEVARAIRGPSLDRAAIDGVFARHDQLIDGARRSALAAFAKIHETLDDRQRKILADLIESGPFARGFGSSC